MPRAGLSIAVLGLSILSIRLTLDAGTQSVDGSIALVGATIYANPEDAPIANGVVLVREGRIAAVGGKSVLPPGQKIQVIDCSGLTITAGFWNSHVHFFERKWTDAASMPAAELERQLEEMLTRYGFTSAFDLGSSRENTRRLRERIESKQVRGPRIRSTGEALVAPGAVPADAVIRALGYMTAQNYPVSDAAQAAAAAKTLLAAGVDGIKVHLQPPPAPNVPIPPDAIRAAVDEAHRAGKLVFIHPNDEASVATAIKAGVDVIAHTTPFSGPWGEQTLAAIKGGQAALTPTVSVWRELLRHDRISSQEQAVKTSIEQLRSWLTAGGVVLFGNDLGAAGYDPTGEYLAMSQAGMTFQQILASLTAAPAQRFGAANVLGRIEPGFIADVTVLSGDPAKDLRLLASVRYTLRDGEVIYSAVR